MKQSVGWSRRLASAHSVATPLRRKRSGIAVKIVVAISIGGVSRYIIVTSPAMLQLRSIEDQVRAGELLVCNSRSITFAAID
jgi:hypothetical protein